MRIPFACLCLLAVCHAENTPAVMFVNLPGQAGWQDFAFLAAVPASRLAQKENRALIALDDSSAIPREVGDYLKRLKPKGVFHIGDSPVAVASAFGKVHHHACASADDAAALLAGKFWRNSAHAVLCRDDDYASALMASTLAARLNAPLLFAGESGFSATTAKALAALKPGKTIFVGNKPANLDATEIKDVTAMLLWMKNNGLENEYLALANIRDRSGTTVRKLSLAAPMFAAARHGMVVPVDMKIRWRQKFPSTDLTGQIPRGIPAQAKQRKSGVIDLPEGKTPFVLALGENPLSHTLYLDLNGDGHFDAEGEGPHPNPSHLEILGKRRFFDAGSQYRGDPETHLTTGSADDLITSMRQLYAQTGIPKYLCLVGFPDAIPQAILSDRRATGIIGETDITSDFPYANADDDLFAEISTGRIIAESATFATLHASRTITYKSLIDPEWIGRAAQARWENTLTDMFENVGLNADAYHSDRDLPWGQEPGQGQEGKRAASFGQDSPLTRVAFLSHTAHSVWQSLGETYDMHSQTLLAPTVMESGGCLTCALDYEPGFRSVVARLLRNGAISFCGNTRVGIAEGEQLRQVFWNTLFTGATLGEAHLRAQNSTAAYVLDTDQTQGGPQHYQLHIHALFGDPAFRPVIPSKPKSAPARIQTQGSSVTVHAPQRWWTRKIFVPEDWKLWADKPLHALRGAGAYATRSWSQEGYDKEQTHVDAQFTTRGKINRITQTTPLDAPLGWDGKHSIDRHPDGSATYHWRVRIADFDQKSGEILKQVDRVDFKLE